MWSLELEVKLRNLGWWLAQILRWGAERSFYRGRDEAVVFHSSERRTLLQTLLVFLEVEDQVSWLKLQQFSDFLSDFDPVGFVLRVF